MYGNNVLNLIDNIMVNVKCVELVFFKNESIILSPLKQNWNGSSI